MEILHRSRSLQRRAGALYDRLVALSGQFKVWITFALFKGMDISTAGDDNEEGEDAEPTVITGDSASARDVFK